MEMVGNQEMCGELCLSISPSRRRVVKRLDGLPREAAARARMAQKGAEVLCGAEISIARIKEEDFYTRAGWAEAGKAWKD